MKEAALGKMPVLFVGHGSPMNAIEDNAFTEALSGLSARLPPEGGVRRVGALGDVGVARARVGTSADDS